MVHCSFPHLKREEGRRSPSPEMIARISYGHVMTTKAEILPENIFLSSDFLLRIPLSCCCDMAALPSLVVFPHDAMIDSFQGSICCFLSKAVRKKSPQTEMMYLTLYGLVLLMVKALLNQPAPETGDKYNLKKGQILAYSVHRIYMRCTKRLDFLFLNSQV